MCGTWHQQPLYPLYEVCSVRSGSMCEVRTTDNRRKNERLKPLEELRRQMLSGDCLSINVRSLLFEYHSNPRRAISLY